MNEKQKLFVILFIPLFAALFVIFKVSVAEQAYHIQDYRINIDLKGDSAVVDEKFIYVLESSYHELYRWFYTANNPLSRLRIMEYSCPEGSTFRMNRLRNGLELVCEGEFNPGVYTVEFVYEIPEPFECASDGCLFHWIVFSEDHARIEKLYGKINADDFETFPLSEKTQNTFYVEDLPGNVPFEIAASVSPPKGAYRHISSAISEYKRIKSRLLFFGYIYRFRKVVFASIAVLFTSVLFAIYMKYGKDFEPSAPEILHYPPEDIRPHELDMYYGRFIGKLEKEVGDAVLLDLARRGVLRIGKKMIIYLDKMKDLDDFESNLLNFYIKYGKREGNRVIFDTEEFKRRLKNRSFALRVSYDLQSIGPTEFMEKNLKRIYDRSGSNLALGVAVLYTLLPFVVLYFESRLFKTFGSGLFAIMFQGFLTIFLLVLLDDFVFGRYTKEGRVKKAYWDAFANLLKNYSLIKKYTPQDIDMWGKWLVYATVFGCADNVVKAMRDLHIELPNVDISTGLRIHTSVWTSTSSALPSHSGGVGAK